MSDKPTIVSIFELLPNPHSDGTPPRSVQDEVALLKAAMAHLKLQIAQMPPEERALLGLTEQRGEIDASAESGAFSNLVESKTSPALIEFTRKQGAVVRVGEIITREGDCIKNFEAIGQSSIQLRLSLEELSKLGAFVKGLIDDIKDGVIKIFVAVTDLAVGFFGSSANMLMDDDSDAAESQSWDESDDEVLDNDFGTKEDRG